MVLNVENIAALLAVIISAFTVYFNFRKLGDNRQKDTEWRTTVNMDLKAIMSNISEIKESYTLNAHDIKNLSDTQIKHTMEIGIISRDISTMWTKIDSLQTMVISNGNSQTDA